jgi:hypothetical protein
MYWGDASRMCYSYFQDHQPQGAIAKPSLKWCRTPQQYQLEFFLRYSGGCSVV